MVTAPVTTASYRNRVFSLVASYLTEVSERTERGVLEAPEIPPLVSSDTDLSPHFVSGQLIALASSWIDLSSADPLIANVSRQVLFQEAAFAAFCGVSNLIIPRPKPFQGEQPGEGLSQYGRAVKEALALGPFMQIQLLLSMDGASDSVSVDDQDSLRVYARPQHISQRGTKINKRNEFNTWDAWNVIRTICKYNSRLSVGKRLELIDTIFIKTSVITKPVITFVEINSCPRYSPFL